MVFNSSKPIYSQIYDMLIRDIINGKYKCGDKIISINEFSKKYVVNQNTVIHAYRELMYDNITISKRGLGFFVTTDTTVINSFCEKRIDSLILSFLKEIKNCGFSKKELLRKIEEVNFDDIN